MIRNLEPRMAFQWWETKWAKNKLRENIGCCPNDEKPMEKRKNLDWVQDGVPMMINHTNKWLSLNRTYDDVSMMRNKWKNIKCERT